MADIVSLVFSLILGVVEGLTEFLPISSTGHLLIASAVLNFPPAEPAGLRATFDIFIQIGAVLAVLIFYWRSLLQQARQIPSDRQTQRFWLNIFIAFLPAAILGLLFLDKIESVLLKPIPVGVALILGGIVFLVVERKPQQGQTHSLEQVTWPQAAAIGVAQVFSLAPGVSRSGASIVGGLLAGLDRVTATTFSFYLFIPTLGMATLYRLFKAVVSHEITLTYLPSLAAATVAAFLVSYLTIRWLLRYVATHSFRAFGVYRIAAGVVIILLALLTTIFKV
jgi:undecaprenyl-diphosphatase